MRVIENKLSLLVEQGNRGGNTVLKWGKDTSESKSRIEREVYEIKVLEEIFKDTKREHKNQKKTSKKYHWRFLCEDEYEI